MEIYCYLMKDILQNIINKPNHKKIAIVGNAPIQYDVSELIDSCDLVVRFNEYINYGKNSGQRADILCVCNTGLPARQISQRASISNAPFFSELSEIWFPRDEDVHLRHVQPFCLEIPLTEYVDRSDLLIESNKLSATQVLIFGPELNEKAYHILSSKAKWPFLCPSSGFLALEYILSESRFFDYDKFLFGFSFRGFKGHPWEAEKQMIMQYAKHRDDLYFIPIYKNLIIRYLDIYHSHYRWRKRKFL